MSCNNHNIRNVDTTVYRPSNCCCSNDDSNVTIQFVDRGFPQYPYPCVRPPFPNPPFPNPPLPTPPMPPRPSVPTPTQSYAQFYNTTAAAETITAGSDIALPSTLYNTDSASILNNNGTITLLGGPQGRAYLVNYRADGTFTNATVGLNINGVNDARTNVTATGADPQSVSGSSIVYVPQNAATPVSLNVVAGTLLTQAGANAADVSVIRIA